jgi:predicted  nucleic acid-binding Zn-ribbon protein
MAQKAEATVEEKLRALFDLQLIDSKIDEIRNLRGELPLEVRDLEDEIAGLTTRIDKLKADLQSTEDAIKEKKNQIEESKGLIKKYTSQQDNVRNNREYNSLSKEIEYQELEIQLAEKHIKELKAQMEHKSEVINQSQERLTDRENHLAHKKAELDKILGETEKEEHALLKEADNYKSQLEARLVNAYERIRTNVKNGQAVVTIERGASGGSFFSIPPQVQVEIASRKKIMTDEHSGRILVDSELAEEERQKMEKFFSKL